MSQEMQDANIDNSNNQSPLKNDENTSEMHEASLGAELENSQKSSHEVLGSEGSQKSSHEVLELDASRSDSQENNSNVRAIEKAAEGETTGSKLKDVKEYPANTIVCREWQTECVREPKGQEVVCSCIPEKDAVLWQIKDFAAFRAAAKVLRMPPLVSPEFGNGCCVRLQIYEKRGHITGHVEVPLLKAMKDGVVHCKIDVIRPDTKVVVSCKVEMKILAPGSDPKALKRTSETFKLTKNKLIGPASVDRLSTDDSLRIRIAFQYFPFDAPIFRGMSKVLSSQPAKDALGELVDTSPKNQRKAELLNDIGNYCKEDPSQYVEVTRDKSTFQACRFLLCARSTKFRDIFGPSNGNPPGSARSASSLFGRNSNSNVQHSLSAVTLQDLSVVCLSQLLTFIHSDSCSWLENMSTDILLILELFEAAKSYGVESLRLCLLRHLAARLDRENFVYIFDVSEKCNDSELKNMCGSFMDSIPGSQVAMFMRVASMKQYNTPADSIQT